MFMLSWASLQMLRCSQAGRTALHTAAWQDHDIQAAGQAYVAAQYSHLNCLRELLDRGAAVNPTDNVSILQRLLHGVGIIACAAMYARRRAGSPCTWLL
jgi:hypothetical protein